MIKSRILFWRIIICSFGWLTNTMVYYGLSLNSVSLAGDRYLSYILVCLIELPGYLITYLGSDRLGRRLITTISFALAGIGCLASIFVSPDDYWSSLALFLIGKCAITVSFTVIYIFTAELFPTPLRNTSLGFCSMLGRIGSIIAPQTPLLGKIWPAFPMVLFGVISLLAAISSLFLPETSGTRLPDTVEQAEKLGRKKEISEITPII